MLFGSNNLADRYPGLYRECVRWGQQQLIPLVMQTDTIETTIVNILIAIRNHIEDSHHQRVHVHIKDTHELTRT